MAKERPLCIYVDVDGTLIHTASDKSLPDRILTGRIREWHEQGAVLYCWSSRGGEYARSIARNLKIEECFVGFLMKPHVLIDDQSLESWAYFMEATPSKAARLSLQEIANELDAH